MSDLAHRRFSARPVHLFLFRRQHLVWRFASAERDLEIGGHTYLAAQIERSEIKQTVERAKDKLTIKIPYLLDPSAPEYPVTQSLGDNWWPWVPTDTVSVICMEYDAGDTAPPMAQWMGQVVQPKFTPPLLELTCEPGNGYDRARGQGMRWQRGCSKSVYSTGLRGCNLDPSSVATPGVLTYVDGLTISVPEFAASAYALAGGYITFTDRGLVVRRDIAAHQQGDTLATLTPGGIVPAVGESVVALPTCARTWQACADRGNTINFGGSLYKPVKSPIDGVSMSWG